MEKIKVSKRITNADKQRAHKNNGKVKLDEGRIAKEVKDNAIFINETQQSEKLINGFYKFYKRKVKRWDYYSLLFCSIVLILMGINFLIEGNDYFFGLVCNIIINSLLILLGLYLLIYDLNYQKYDLKESQEIYNDDISKFINYYYFGDKEMVLINKEGMTSKRYYEIEAIYEARKFYYIFLSPTSGVVMAKDSFTRGRELEFHDFIKRKMEKKYKKRCFRCFCKKDKD